MKIKLSFYIIIFLLLVFASHFSAQIVEKISISSEEASIQMVTPSSYLLEIGGPNNYYWKQEVEFTNEISISNSRSDGQKFVDGKYKLQITPIIKLSDSERLELRALMSENDANKISNFRIKHNLPEIVNLYSIGFSIRNGTFVSQNFKETKDVKLPSMSSIWQKDHPALYASLNNVEIGLNTFTYEETTPLATDNTSLNADDQIFTDDLIVIASMCLGTDCVNGETFGYNALKFKENNLRVLFHDTSNTSNFPTTDWEILINATHNGGSEYFAIKDASTGRIPFVIESGASPYALFLSDDGRIGMNTTTPTGNLHMKVGDTPNIILDQDASSGWSPQQWDIGGNESSFFIRDNTHSAKMPFRIKPGSPANSLTINANGNIGLGEFDASEKLHLPSGNIYLENGSIGINVAPTFPLDIVGNSRIIGNIGINKEPSMLALDVLGNSKFIGTTLYQGDVSYFLNTGTSFLSPTYQTVMRIDATNQRVGIGTAKPSHELEVCGTIATTAATVTTNITCSSDIRFKKNIKTLSSALDKIMQVRGVSYNWKVNYFPEKRFNEGNQIGFIAQEFETLFPELVLTDDKGYKSIDYTKFAPVLVEAMKEQQTEIESLKAQIATLSEMVFSLNARLSQTSSATERIGEKE